jgi:hypothetical protein
MTKRRLVNIRSQFMSLARQVRRWLAAPARDAVGVVPARPPQAPAERTGSDSAGDALIDALGRWQHRIARQRRIVAVRRQLMLALGLGVICVVVGLLLSTHPRAVALAPAGLALLIGIPLAARGAPSLRTCARLLDHQLSLSERLGTAYQLAAGHPTNGLEARLLDEAADLARCTYASSRARPRRSSAEWLTAAGGALALAVVLVAPAPGSGTSARTAAAGARASAASRAAAQLTSTLQHAAAGTKQKLELPPQSLKLAAHGITIRAASPEPIAAAPASTPTRAPAQGASSGRLPRAQSVAGASGARISSALPGAPPGASKQRGAASRRSASAAAKQGAAGAQSSASSQGAAQTAGKLGPPLIRLPSAARKSSAPPAVKPNGQISPYGGNIAGVPLHQRESLFTTQHTPGTPRGATPGGRTAGNEPGGASNGQSAPNLSITHLLSLLGGQTLGLGSLAKATRGSVPGNSRTGQGRSQQLGGSGALATAQLAYVPADSNSMAGNEGQLVAAYFETVAAWLVGSLR